MNAITVDKTSEIRVLSSDELGAVNGGVIPLAVAVYYSAGFVAGVVGGWTFGKEIFK
ncbi:MAG: class IIb bacteriocin, lactobin A/cerein 7B family [Shewanella sp.]